MSEAADIFSWAGIEFTKEVVGTVANLTLADVRMNKSVKYRKGVERGKTSATTPGRRRCRPPRPPRSRPPAPRPWSPTATKSGATDAMRVPKNLHKATLSWTTIYTPTYALCQIKFTFSELNLAID